MTVSNFLTLVGAVAGLARLLTKENGPMNLFVKYRAFATRNFKGQKQLKELFLCPFCLTVWFAMGLYALLMLVPKSRVFLEPLGLTGWVYTLLAMQGYFGPIDGETTP